MAATKYGLKFLTLSQFYHENSVPVYEKEAKDGSINICYFCTEQQACFEQSLAFYGQFSLTNWVAAQGKSYRNWKYIPVLCHS